MFANVMMPCFFLEPQDFAESFFYVGDRLNCGSTRKCNVTFPTINESLISDVKLANVRFPSNNAVQQIIKWLLTSILEIKLRAF